MMSVIVQKAVAPYAASMVSAVFRVLALIALVVMPLGMTGGPALAHIADQAMSSAAHCDGQPKPSDAPANMQMDCTASCTAVPAPVAAVPVRSMSPQGSLTIAVVTPFSSVEPELTTPPPKFG